MGRKAGEPAGLRLAGGRLEPVRFGRVRNWWRVICGACRGRCAVGKLRRVAEDGGRVRMNKHMQVRCDRRLAWAEVGPELGWQNCT